MIETRRLKNVIFIQTILNHWNQLRNFITQTKEKLYTKGVPRKRKHI